VKGWVAAASLTFFLGSTPALSEDTFLNIAFGARALALGGAYTAISDDAQAALWNPAGLAQVHQVSLSGSQNHLSFTQNVFAMTLTMPVQRWGTAALAVQEFNVDNLALTRPVLDVNGNPVLDPTTNQPLVEITGFGAETDGTFLLGYGVAISPWLMIGGAGKVLVGKVGKILGSGYGANAGFILQVARRWRIGLVAEDLGRTTVHWQDGLRTIMEPSGRMGVAWASVTRWLVSAEARSPLLEADVGGVKSAFGAEWRYADFLIFRLGADDFRISGGVGFRMSLGKGRSFASADYAFVTGSQFEDRNRLTLAVSF